MKARLRDLAGRTLRTLGATRPAARARGRLTIATFHRVLPEAQRRAYPFPGLAVTPAELRWFLQWFGQHFRCGTLAQAHRAVTAGEETEQPWLAVSFDDAQLDNYEQAAPVLEAEGIAATFFAPVAHVESGQLLWPDRLGFAVASAQGEPRLRADLASLLRDHGLSDPGPGGPGSAGTGPGAEAVTAAAKGLPEPRRRALVQELESAFGPDPTPPWAGMMGWDELAVLAASGHEIGSHTMTHPILPSCDDERVAAEVGDSRRLLEARLGCPVESFCYPNGDADVRVEGAVRSAGYERAVTTAWGTNGRDHDPLALRRCDIRSEHCMDARGALSGDRLAWRLSGLPPRPR